MIKEKTKPFVVIPSIWWKGNSDVTHSLSETVKHYIYNRKMREIDVTSFNE